MPKRLPLSIESEEASCAARFLRYLEIEMDELGREWPTHHTPENVHEVWMHELRTPLTVAKLRLNLLRRRLRRGEENVAVEAALDQIEGTLNDLAAVIARMDGAARRDEG